jgi:hypothetical protein
MVKRSATQRISTGDAWGSEVLGLSVIRGVLRADRLFDDENGGGPSGQLFPSQRGFASTVAGESRLEHCTVGKGKRVTRIVRVELISAVVVNVSVHELIGLEHVDAASGETN